MDLQGDNVRGSLSKGSIFGENSERLGQQERLRVEPGSSRLPVLNAEPLGSCLSSAEK